MMRTIEEMRGLAKGLLDMAVYILGDRTYKALPELLKRDYGLSVQERLKRGYLKDIKGRHIEVNIIGEGIKDSKKIIIIGECKARLSKKGVDEFIEKKLEVLKPLFEEVFPVMVTHMISEPDVEDYARLKGIALYYSYDF